MIAWTSALRTFLGDHDNDIWSESDLQEYLNIGLAWWNLLPPETKYSFSDTYLLDSTAVLLAAVIHATTDLVIGLDDDTLHSTRHGVTLTERQYMHYHNLFKQAEEQFEQSKRKKLQVVSSREPIWH